MPSAVIEVQGKLIQTQQQIIEVQDENVRLEEELKKVKQAQENEASITFHDGAYWQKRGDKEEGPFCPSCWGLEKKLVMPEIFDGTKEPMELVCSHHAMPRYFHVPGRLAKYLKGGAI